MFLWIVIGALYLCALSVVTGLGQICSAFGNEIQSFPSISNGTEVRNECKQGPAETENALAKLSSKLKRVKRLLLVTFLMSSVIPRVQK